MTVFLRLLEDSDKSLNLETLVEQYRDGKSDGRIFSIAPSEFFSIPSAPFAYWISDAIRSTFSRYPLFEMGGRTTKQGLATAEDFRFVRVWWETKGCIDKWRGFAKGGTFSPYYSDVHLVVNWHPGEREMWSVINPMIGKPKSNIWMLPETIKTYFFRPGITWPRRTKSKLSMRVLPPNCIFADKGPAIFAEADNLNNLSATLALSTSRAFHILVETQLAAADARAGGAAHSFEVGVIQKTPIPNLSPDQTQSLVVLTRRAWSLKRILDTIQETSHAFVLPTALRARLGDYTPLAIETELASIQAEIDAIAFELYEFNEDDRNAVKASQSAAILVDSETSDDEETDEEESTAPIYQMVGLLSWAVGVAFGRFDWRLATGERSVPTEPEPFDPLPAKSPGMLPDGVEPFHQYAGILVDDQGHQHDLARLVEEVLVRVDAPAPDDVRRWLQRDFFAFHLQRYSKSRRKAPIYWPLSTASGSYTLWVYYPALNNQTLFSVVNDFLDGHNGKLTHVSRECAELRVKGSGRSRDEEKQYETLQAFEQELTDLRDTLLKIAPTYQPNHDDGVQITAAPLWPLFRHKPWQKVLKDTWAKLEKGDYDWAHLALAYWPERVREKCKTDKSLAIAHGLEDLYVEPEAAPKKARGRKKSGAVDE